MTLHRKPYFLFRNVLKRWSFQKNLTPWTENKRWSFSKKYTEMWYFLQMSWKDGLFKRDCAGTWPFLYSLERWWVFPVNIIFPWEESERRSFSRNTWKYGIFCVHVRVLQTWPHTSLSKKKKKSKMILSRKNAPEGDWRSRLKF